MKQYTGKMYWVKTKIEGDELNPIDSNQIVDYSYLENIIVTENHIQFETESFESADDPNLSTHYQVNLKPSNHDSSSYQGGYSKQEKDNLISENITCELFTNHKGLMLHGQWKEKNKHYLFWVHLTKK